MIIYTVVIVLIGILALVGTLVAGRQVNRTVESIDHLSPEDQEKHLRDHHFSDVKKNLGVLIWIYVITFVVAIIGAAVYMIYFK